MDKKPEFLIKFYKVDSYEGDVNPSEECYGEMLFRMDIDNFIKLEKQITLFIIDNGKMIDEE